MKLKKAETADIKFIAEVCLDARKLYDEIMPGAFEKQAKKYVEKGLPTYYEMFVVESNNMPVGFYADKLIGTNTVYIVGLYILSKFQNLGYGKSVLEIIENKCEKNKINKMILLVHKDAKWAINFYKKNGFEIVGTNKEEAKMIESSMEELYIDNTYLMCKNII